MKLRYGSDYINLNLPVEVPRVILESKKAAPLQNPHQAILDALHNPIGSPPLNDIVNRGDSVSILVNDSTRVARSDLFLPVLIEELVSVGIHLEDIFIQFTNGTHRLLEEDEMIAIVGKDVASKVKMYNHHCDISDQLVFLGHTTRNTPVYVNKRVAEADRRILTGSVVHHFFAGYGGGRKALMPGVAGWETISKNHSLMLSENARSGILDGNPVHEDLLEAAKKVGADFLLNTVLNADKEILGIFAGDMVTAHRAACDMVKQVNGYNLNVLADVVIASCGGYPKDINLYQAHKSLDNALAAMKPGGQLILLARCEDGVGSSLYEEWATRHNDLKTLETALKKNFVLGGHKAYTVAKLLQKGKVFLVSDFEPAKASTFGFIPAKSLDQAIAEVYCNSYDLHTYIIPQASTLMPGLTK